MLVLPYSDKGFSGLCTCVGASRGFRRGGIVVEEECLGDLIVPHSDEDAQPVAGACLQEDCSPSFAATV